MAHTLQLAVHDGLLTQRLISDILAMWRQIIGHFKRSPQAYCAFHDVQQQLGQDCLLELYILYEFFERALLASFALL